VERNGGQTGRATAPERFLAALNSISQADVRPEVQLTEVPAPRRSAPFAVAIDGEIDPDAANLGVDPGIGYQFEPASAQGTFIVLYDPQGQTNWDGQFRVVTFLEVEVDPVEAADQMLPSIAWTWVIDAIEPHLVHQLSGTVTVQTSSSFSDLTDSRVKARLQIRASWSPTSDQLGAHLEMWAEMLAMASGLERKPSEVTYLADHRNHHHHGVAV